MNKNLLRRLYGMLFPVTACLVTALATSLQLKAQVNSYAFSQSTGTFSSIKTTGTPIDSASYASGGNTLDTKGWSITLPFSFIFNGIPYTSIYANSDGGLTFGSTTNNSSTLISDATTYPGAIAAMNRDLWGIYVSSGTVTNGSNVITNITSFYGLSIGAKLANVDGIPSGATVTALDQTAGTITMSANATSNTTTASIRRGIGKLYTYTTGTAPNRNFIIEWSDFSDYNTSASNNQTRFSFQIVLEETLNKINIIYGDYTTLSTSSRSNQVGLRGATNTDYNNRTGSAAWTATTAGTANSSTVSRSNTTFPASGLTFTWTPPSCLTPNSIQVSSITAASANITWTAPIPAPANGYEYYYSTSNTAPTATTTPSGTTAAGVTTATPSGLAGNTTYYVWLRSACSATDKSAWSASVSFTTLCAAYPTPFNEAFEGTAFVPTCWSQASGLLASPTVFGSTNNYWNQQNYGNASVTLSTSTNKSARFNVYGTSRKDWLITPPIDLGTTPKQLEFDMSLTAFNNSTAATLGTDDTVAVVISTDNGATWTKANVLRSWNNTTPIANGTGSHIIIDLTAYNGIVKIGFYAQSTVSNADNDLFIDNVKVIAIPNCQVPAGLSASAVTSNGATISWTAASPVPANGYEYYYSTSGTAPTATTVPSGSTAAGILSADLSGLASNTTYYAWVRSACSPTQKSAWTTSTSFTTLCSVYPAPFTEAFEGATFVPTCWLQASGLLASPTVFGTTNNYWSQQNYGDVSVATSTNKSSRINLFGSSRKDWLITPSIDLGTTPKQLEFDIALTAFYTGTATTLGVDDTVAVVISTNNGATWTKANVLRSWNKTTPIPNGAGDHIIINLTAYTGIIKIGFYAESTVSNADNDLFIDNVKVINIPTCQIPTGLNVSMAGLNNATISWTASTSAPANGYEYYYSTSNTAPTAATIPSGSTAAGVTTANITGLTPNMTYYAWVRSNCSATDKSTWTNAISFYNGYCTPVATSTSTYINGVTSSGGISNISNPATGFTTGGYADYYNTNSMTILAGGTANFSFTLAGGTTGVSIYVDLDNNLIFSAAERLYTSSAYLANGTHSVNIPIPASTMPGSYRARIITDFNNTTPVPCGFGSGRGEAEDYKIIVPDCTIPVVNLGNDTAICSNATLTLNAGNSGATYSWSTGATSQTINVTTAGTYTVAVSNNVCVGRDTIVVTINQVPVVNLGADTAICAGNTLTLNAGNAGAAYLWDNAATTQTRTVNTAGTYSVAVTNTNGCKGRDTITVTVTPLPVVNLGNDTFFCAGNSIELDATAPGATYLWDNASTAAIRNVNTAGTYFVAVTANMCTAHDTINIAQAPLPVVNLGNDAAICNGSSITLNAGNAGASYLWDNAATAQTRSVNMAGTYFVAVTDANGCKGSDTITVVVTTPPVVNLGNDTSFCSGTSIQLDATAPGATYLWDNASTAAMRTVNAAGTYFVAVTANTCTTRDTITIGEMPTPVVNLGNDTSICNNNTITLDAGNQGADYLWSTGAMSQMISANTAGTYYVSVTLAGLCVTTDTIVVPMVAGPAISGINATYTNAATYNFNALDTQGVVSYTWDFGDSSPTENGYMVQHTYTANGIYTVTCTGEGSCENTMITVSRTVDVFDATTGIGNVKNDKNWMVYPNPVNNVLTIENKAQVKITEVVIYTITGQRIKTLNTNSTTVKVDVAELASGMYMLHAQDADGITLIKKIEIRK